MLKLQRGGAVSHAVSRARKMTAHARYLLFILASLKVDQEAASGFEERACESSLAADCERRRSMRH